MSTAGDTQKLAAVDTTQLVAHHMIGAVLVVSVPTHLRQLLTTIVDGSVRTQVSQNGTFHTPLSEKFGRIFLS